MEIHASGAGKEEGDPDMEGGGGGDPGTEGCTYKQVHH